MKNKLLAYPSDWFLDESIIEPIKQTLPLLVEFGKSEFLEDPEHYPIMDHVKEKLPEIFTFPFLSEIFCKILLDEVKTLDFSPNPEEDELRQIPEVVLSESLAPVYLSLREVIQNVLNPIFLSIWGRQVSSAHIQVANYNVRDKRQGAWHHDRSADITVVVPLNTGEYLGGGTEFMRRGIVEPLPTGHALAFPSLTHMHRGLPVSEGDRYLLVFWLRVGNE